MFVKAMIHLRTCLKVKVFSVKSQKARKDTYCNARATKKRIKRPQKKGQYIC